MLCCAAPAPIVFAAAQHARTHAIDPCCARALHPSLRSKKEDDEKNAKAREEAAAKQAAAAEAQFKADAATIADAVQRALDKVHSRQTLPRSQMLCSVLWIQRNCSPSRPPPSWRLCVHKDISSVARARQGARRKGRAGRWHPERMSGTDLSSDAPGAG